MRILMMMMRMIATISIHIIIIIINVTQPNNKSMCSMLMMTMTRVMIKMTRMMMMMTSMMKKMKTLPMPTRSSPNKKLHLCRAVGTAVGTLRPHSLSVICKIIIAEKYLWM